MGLSRLSKNRAVPSCHPDENQDPGEDALVFRINTEINKTDENTNWDEGGYGLSILS